MVEREHELVALDLPVLERGGFVLDGVKSVVALEGVQREAFRDQLLLVGMDVVQVAEVVYAGVSPDLLVHTGPDMVGIGIQGIS